MKTFIKKPLVLTIILLTTCLSSNTFATSPTFSHQNWWSPASPENGGNGIAVSNETTAEIVVKTKAFGGSPVPYSGRGLVLKPKSYDEYFDYYGVIRSEYGYDGFKNTNLPEQERKKYLFCGKNSDVIFQSHSFARNTETIKMTGQPTGSVSVKGYHNIVYTIRWEWVYRYNIKEHETGFLYTRTICFFTITSEHESGHHH